MEGKEGMDGWKEGWGMERKTLRGCSACGGEVISHIDTLAITTDDYTGFLDDVVIGECESCGARYYPAETSQLMDEEVQKALNEKRLTKRSLSNLRILSARSLLKGQTVFGDRVLERLGDLEQTVEQLVQTNA